MNIASVVEVVRQLFTSPKVRGFFDPGTTVGLTYEGIESECCRLMAKKKHRVRNKVWIPSSYFVYVNQQDWADMDTELRNMFEQELPAALEEAAQNLKYSKDKTTFSVKFIPVNAGVKLYH